MGRKILSLVLALALISGLCVISANAADSKDTYLSFTDANGNALTGNLAKGTIVTASWYCDEDSNINAAQLTAKFDLRFVKAKPFESSTTTWYVSTKMKYEDSGDEVKLKVTSNYITSTSASSNKSTARTNDSNYAVLLASSGIDSAQTLTKGTSLYYFQVEVTAEDGISAYELSKYVTLEAVGSASSVTVAGVEGCRTYFTNASGGTTYSYNLTLTTYPYLDITVAEKTFYDSDTKDDVAESLTIAGFDSVGNAIDNSETTSFGIYTNEACTTELETLTSNSAEETTTLYAKTNNNGYVGSFNIGTVKKDAIESISVKTNPTKLEYTAFESFDAAGLVVEATATSGKVKTLTSDEYKLYIGTTEVTSDYKLAVSDKKVTVKAVADNTKTADIVITVNAKSSCVTFTDKTVTYDGNSQTIEATNLPTGVTATYEIKDSNQQKVAQAINAGTYSVTATYSGNTANYSGLESSTKTLTINKKDIIVTADAISAVYGESEKTLTYTVDGLIGADATSMPFTGSLAKAAGTDAGSYDITQGDLVLTSNNYDMTFVGGTYTISAKEVTAVISDITAVTYNAAEQKPIVEVKDGTTVIPSTEYDVTYNNNTNAGTSTVTVTDKTGGNYTFTEVTKDFTINPLAYTTESYADENKSITVIKGDGNFTDPVIYGLNEEVLSGTYTYTLNAQASSKANIITSLSAAAKGSFTPAVQYTFTVTEGNYAGTSITGTIAFTVVDIVFEGQDANAAYTIKQTPTYGDTWGEIVTINADRIIATVAGNAVAGTYTVKDGTSKPDAGEQTYTIVFNSTDNTYKDVTVIDTRKVTISPKSEGLTVGDIEAVTYKNAAWEPAVVVKDADTILIKDTDYTVAYTNNVKIGTEATATVTFKGNYSGTITKKFQIKPIEVELEWSEAALTYNGSKQTVTATVKGVLDGDTCTVKEYDNNEYTNAGTYTAKANGLTNTGYVIKQDFVSKEWTIAPLVATINWSIPSTEALVYSGTAKEVLATVGNKCASDSFELVYENNKATDAGDYTAKLTALGNANYTLDGATGTTAAWTISKKSVTPAITDIEAKTYTGEALTPAVEIKDGTTVIPATEYTVEYTNNTNAGTATVTVKNAAAGNYTIAQTTKNFTINPLVAEISWDTQTVDLVYSGAEKTVTATVSNKKGQDTVSLTVESNKATNAGDYTAKVTAISNANYTLTGAASTTSAWTISRKSVTPTITDIDAYTYDSSAKTPDVIVNDGTTVIPDTEYTVEYSNNTNAGQATVTVKDATGGNYAIAQTSKEFTINPTVAVITWNIPSVIVYNGEAQSVSATVACLGQDSVELTYEGNKATNAGVYTAKVTALSNANYTLDGAVSTSVAWTISRKGIVTPTISDIEATTYDGTAKTPTIEVKDGTTVIPDTEYTVEYSDNINAGINTAKATIKDKEGGNYEIAQTTKNFTINPVVVAVDWTVPQADKLVYDGTEKTVTAEVTNAIGTDVINLTYSDNAKTVVGSYTAAITAIDNTNYTTAGAVGLTTAWAITKATYDMSVITMTDSAVTYNGEVQTLNYAGTLPAGITASSVVKRVKDENGTAVTESEAAGNGAKNAGVYEVTAKFEVDTANYNTIEDKKATLTINKCEVSVDDFEVADKVYDGNIAATVTPGAINGLKDADAANLSVKVESAVFTDAAVGIDKEVKVVISLDGTAKNNYKLSETEVVLKAAIADDKSSVKEEAVNISTPSDDTAKTELVSGGGITDETTRKTLANAVITALTTSEEGKQFAVDLGHEMTNLVSDSESLAADREGAAEKISNAGISIDPSKTDDDVAIVVVPEVKTQISGIKADATGKLLEITLDISASYKKYATLDKDATPVAGTNAVQIGEETAVTEVSRAVTITVSVPAGFAETGDSFVWVEQIHNGKTFVYKASLTDGVVSIDNPFGFSSFALVPASKITKPVEVDNGLYTLYYDTLAAAVGSLTGGETVTITDDAAAGTAAVSKEISFTIVNQSGATPVSAGSGYKMSKNGNEYTFVYAPEEPHFAYVVEAIENENATVTVDPKIAYAGEVISFTVEAKDGYKVDSINVNGVLGEVAYTTVKEGSYTFIMPDCRAQITVVTSAAEKEKEEEVQIPFVDVSELDYFAKPVAWAYQNQVTAGVDDTHFDPFGLCTRAEAVTFLYGLAGHPEITKTVDFEDVNTDDYYYNAVQWAYAYGITSGTSTEKLVFSPHDNCTRAEMVLFLSKFAKAGNATVTGQFIDVPAGAYYENAVYWAYECGITSGVDELHTLFVPEEDSTRSEVVTFLYQFFNKFLKKE